MLQVLIPIVLLANGLAAGVLVGTQLGGQPLLESLPADRYVHAHAFFSTRFDPFMPLCLIVTVLGDLTLGLVVEHPIARLLYITAAGLCLGTVAISLVKNVPVNRWIRTLDPGDLPADFDQRDPRRSWGASNRLRTATATFALVINCSALGLSL